MDALKTVVFVGDEAMGRMADASFCAAWDALYDACPWATVGQRADFVRAVWSILRHEQAVLVTQTSRDGELLGVLPLSQHGDRLTGAAEYDSEYHSWICRADHSANFMPAALAALRHRVGPLPLELTYVAADVPLDWARRAGSASGAGSAVSSWCELLPTEHQVMPLGTVEEVEAHLEAKRGLRRKHAKLRSSGNLTFTQVKTPAELEQMMEKFEPLFDFRKGATHGVTGFRDTPWRGQLLRELGKLPNMLSTYRLELNGEFIAGHLGLVGRGKMFSLGGMAHNEFWSRFSPGLILISEMVRIAAKDGFTLFDLTPGPDGYKRLWGTERRDAYKLFVRPSTLQRTGRTANILVRRAASAVRHPSATFNKLVGRTEEPSCAEACDEARLPDESFSLFEVTPATKGAVVDWTWNVNRTEDLLCHPAAGEPYWRFLRDAKELISSRARTYSRVVAGRLVDLWFVIPIDPKAAFTSSDGQPKSPAPRGGIAYRAEHIANAIGNNDVAASLASLAAQVALEKGGPLLLAAKETPANIAFAQVPFGTTLHALLYPDRSEKPKASPEPVER